ncbi:cytochrome b5-like heme/steroid binding domain-containing protein [Sporobolomyces salmoneus]|uniref:cytochrome b5-like heme/steroid binding domain-containing protein n=1 Tax=Sporobolomyces salmoneus TaxID=183962 RepID=UPI0031779A8F
MFSSITNAIGLTSSSPSSTPTPTMTLTDSSIAEPDTTSVQFPSLHSQQRAQVPSFQLNSDPDGSTSPSFDEDETPNLPEIKIEPSSSSLAPPTTTQKVVKAPKKARVRVEKGFSQLDWAKLNRDPSVDLRGGITELKIISVEELAMHDKEEDCWQCYGGKVYNVTRFLRFHPGGGGEMLRGGGKDVLAHAWVNYETLLENCLIGFLVHD